MYGKRVVFCFLFFLLVFGLGAQTKTENVFIVVIDGARYTETFGDSEHKYIPNIWNELRGLGVIYTQCYNDGQTSTNPGHASIVTGTWQNIDNDGQGRPTKPTIFEYYRKEKNAPMNDAAVVLGKKKLDILSYSRTGGYGWDLRAREFTTEDGYSDSAALGSVKRAIRARARLAIVNLPETDAQGHSGQWDNYVGALKRADNITKQIWDLLQADDQYRDKTTLIITDDHGRHSGDNFDNHGDSCDGCRHVQLMVIGPDTPAGVVDDTRVSLIDIVPTVGKLLGFETPKAEGHVINSVFAESVKAGQ